MAKFNVDNTVLTIRDYTISGEFIPFMDKYPFQNLILPSKGQTGETLRKLFWIDEGGENKPTSKMNVSLRGAKGRFVSYKNLPKNYVGLREVIQSLPNI